MRSLASRLKRRVFSNSQPAGEQQLAGRFQPYSHTLPNRYPWLFEFAAANLAKAEDCRLLCFGCSRGDEVFALRDYIPCADIKGIDIVPANVALCDARALKNRVARVSFAAAPNTVDEPSSHYDAIFCLAVLCHGDVTARRAQRCDPLIRFEDFSRAVSDFERCLKPGG